MKKYFCFISIGLALLLSGLLGFRAGLSQSKEFDSKAYEGITLENDAAKLRVFMDISEDIQAREYASAKCEADLAASRLLDEVNECIRNEACKTQLSDVFQEQIPFILADREPNFKYYKNNEICKS